jgi:polyphenol oxidase
MAFYLKHGLKYYSFELYESQKIFQGIFTRDGGVSPAPWNSLNLGGTVGDERSNIIENRKRIFSIFNRPVESIYDVWQVHGTDVICTMQPRPLEQAHIKADAILTNNPQVTLFMLFADCVPILLFDPVLRVVGIAHAGWKGTVNKIAACAVQKMKEVYGSEPQNILAGIGPSIGPDHYEVGEEVIGRVKSSFGINANEILFHPDHKTHLNLWEANRLILNEQGVTQVQVAEICTACHTEEWFSHRGDKGKTGRFGALIALQ